MNLKTAAIIAAAALAAYFVMAKLARPAQRGTWYQTGSNLNVRPGSDQDALLAEQWTGSVSGLNVRQGSEQDWLLAGQWSPEW